MVQEVNGEHRLRELHALAGAPDDLGHDPPVGREQESQSESQRLQQQSLSDLYIQNKAIEKWDGKLPQFSGTSALPFIQVQSAPTPGAGTP